MGILSRLGKLFQDAVGYTAHNEQRAREYELRVAERKAEEAKRRTRVLANKEALAEEIALYEQSRKAPAYSVGSAVYLRAQPDKVCTVIKVTEGRSYSVPPGDSDWVEHVRYPTVCPPPRYDVVRINDMGFSVLENLGEEVLWHDHT